MNHRFVATLSHSILAVTLSMFSVNVLSASLDLAELGALNLQYQQLEVGQGFPGPPLAAEVTYRPGEAVSLVTPVRIQQITYPVAPGQSVTKGDVIAEMSGPEIHHLVTEFAVISERYRSAEARFERNQALYESKSIDEARWLEISDTYYALKLEHEHLRHFTELLLDDSEDPDHISFTAPTSGLLQYRQAEPGIAEGNEIALILPEQALRLRVAVPINSRTGLSHLEFKNCQLAVASISGVAEGFFLRAWSEPLPKSCPLLPGQQLMVRPIYEIQGYEIPKAALTHWQGEPAVFLKSDNRLELVKVEVLGSISGGYYVSSRKPLAGRDILKTSVSAAQGILLKLGGE
jgi:hypothetical protein